MIFVTALIFAAILGLIPAAIAKQKGYSFGLWWFYGWMLFIVALIHSILLKDKAQPEVPQYNEYPQNTAEKFQSDSKENSTVFELARDLYQDGAPVVISVASLVKNEQSGEIAAHIVLHSVSEKPLKAVEVVISTKDIFGKPLGEPVKQQYIDLNTRCGGVIGKNKFISIPDSSVRAMEVVVSAAVFDDSTMWESTSKPWISGTAPAVKKVASKSKRPTIATGGTCTLALRSDGAVVATGATRYGIGNVSGLKDIVSISANTSHAVGLKADGTVVALGPNRSGQCNVSDWKNITAIATGIYHTIGLRSDGSVIAVGGNSQGQCNVSDWSNIVAVAASDYKTIGLKKDGSIVMAGSVESEKREASNWTDLESVAAGSRHTVGLGADGTVVAAGNNGNGQCNVADWKNIVAIAAGLYHTVGLKSDGTVVAVGSNSCDQCAVSAWTGVVAIAANGNCTVALRSDGTVVATGANNSGQCDVSQWDNIMLPE